MIFWGTQAWGLPETRSIQKSSAIWSRLLWVPEPTCAPCTRFCLYPAGYRQNLVQGAHVGSGTQSRRDQMADDFCIERVSGNPHACVPQKIIRPPASFSNRWADVD